MSPIGLTQSEAYVQQLAATNPTLYKWAFGSPNLLLNTMSSVINNPAYTGVSTGTGVSAGTASAISSALGYLPTGNGSSILSNPAYTGAVTSTVADRQVFNAQLAAFDQKYGDILSWGASASPLASQLLKESNASIQREATTGVPQTAGGGLGALGVLMGIGNLLPETPAIGATMGYESLL